MLILPATSGGSYADVLGERGIENLKGWVARGGVLVGIGNANRVSWLIPMSTCSRFAAREHAVSGDEGR